MSGAARASVELPHGSVHFRDTGSGDTLVFLHGLLMNGSVWRPVVQRLEQEFRCIVPDLPLGSHSVPLRGDADVSPRGVARLVNDFFEALDVDSITLIGNDTGGAIAQLVASDRPRRLARLILTPCDAYENFLPPAFRYLQLAARIPMASDVLIQSMRVHALRRTPITYGWLSKTPIDPQMLESWIKPALRSGGVRRDAQKLLRGISSRDTIAAAEALKSADIPVLIAWAPEDRYFSLKYGERLARDIPGATFRKIEDSYTLVSLDQPDRTAQLIAEFVRGE
jgi:pimeloyl-ACP methyl ester carboxylesterase